MSPLLLVVAPEATLLAPLLPRGADVLVATAPEEARALALEHVPDGVTCAVGPDAPWGLDLLAALRSWYPDVRLVALATAELEPETWRGLSALAVFDCVPREAAAARLREALVRALSRAGEPRSVPQKNAPAPLEGATTLALEAESAVSASSLPLLAQAALARSCERHGLPPKLLSQEAMRALRQHEFRDGPRELSAILERAAVLSGEVSRLEAGDLLLPLPGLPSPLEGWSLPREGASLPALLAELEEDLLHESLRRSRQSRTAAASQLGLQRTTLVQKLRRHSGRGNPRAGGK